MAKRIEDVWPLTPLQEGLLFHSLFDDQHPDVYVVQDVRALEGPLDASRLRTTWETVLARHPTLRASFHRPSNADDFVQIIPARVRLPWREVDLSELPREEALDQAARLAKEERERRFDLAAPPLLRLLLVRLDEKLHHLVMTNHHILMDGWSLPLLHQEVSAVYEAGGDAGRLPPVTPYRDYLAWLHRQDKDAAREAWRTELADLDGPTLFAPSADHGPRDPRYTQTQAKLDAAATTALLEMARDRELTLNTVVQGCWALLLGQLTARDDVVFGATAAGRPPELPGVEDMLGLFITTVPVRVRLDAGRRVRDVLGDLLASQSRLTPHHYLGLSEIQRVGGPGTGFDTLVIFESYPQLDDPRESAGSLLITPVHGHNLTHYPVSLAVFPGPELLFVVTCRSDLVDESTAGQLAERLIRVLRQVAADDERRVEDFDVLLEGERDWLLGEVAVGDVPAESASTVVEAFAAQVAAHPNATAVIAGQDSWTYADLDARTNRLAHHLLGLGLAPGDRAAVALPR
ncbi:condensation domain-containing protein, partial [Streptomyces sp. B6B3]|uniref:condensation domain-containing protein n=1 Tax=Streptomyces sp. B6B3 TaxID=3153570 RepID=UPI00325DFF5B